MLIHQPKSILNKCSGFTLMELIIVIIILGVMSVGISGFITLSTQTYLNVTERDELLANARFSVERLNREVRNAVPNSIRENRVGTRHCLEFVPIITSTVYTEIPVAPEGSSDTINVIPFQLPNDADPVIIVYPLNSNEVYQDHSDNSGKAFQIDSYVANSSTLTLTQAVTFTEDSPTRRAYIFNQAVSYCLNGSELTRYSNYGFQAVQPLPPAVDGSLMAKELAFASSEFVVIEASLQRNAIVQIKLNFIRDSEEVTFENAIHISNIP
jgi:MSHA biogenesis protein MshO